MSSNPPHLSSHARVCPLAWFSTQTASFRAKTAQDCPVSAPADVKAGQFYPVKYVERLVEEVFFKLEALVEFEEGFILVS